LADGHAPKDKRCCLEVVKSSVGDLRAA
jgi:hypothetical protein